MLAEVIIHHVFFNQVCNNDAVALDAWMHQFKMAAAASRVGTFIAELAGIGGKGEGEQGLSFKCCSISRVYFSLLRFCF